MKLTRKLKHGYLRLRQKILKEKLSPEAIARGWALGMFVGCSVPFGLQLIVSVPIAIVWRVSKIGATFGTLLTNPVTIWFIYPAQTWIVNHLFFGGTLAWDRFPKESAGWTWEYVSSLSVDVIASFFLGGLILALIMTPLTYFFVKRLVVTYRTRHDLARKDRAN